jgi:thioredoxin reductase
VSAGRNDGAETGGRTRADPASALYTAELADPRAMEAQPRARGRRAAAAAGPTSDVTRFRGVPLASAIGALVAVVAALASLAGSGGSAAAALHGAPGPLSRPHLRAALACAACHVAGPEGRPALPAASACPTCHGAHASVRRGHTASRASGAMSCVTCHPIHASDQGVSFAAGAPALRFAPGAEASVPGVLFAPTARGVVTTVAIPTVASCRGCHDPGAPADPIARCMIEGQEALGDARPVVCFDEHTPAMAVDVAATRPRETRAGASVVCAGQHTEDRAIAWEAAREAAAVMPIVRRASPSGGPAAWLASGLLAAALALAVVRGRDALLERRRARAREQAPALAALSASPRVRLPQIDASTCLGCYACVDACPYDVLQIERYVAVVARPDACCGLILCEQQCPNGSLTIADGAPIGDRPRLAGDLESRDVPGLYLAGDVTGLPLIKNAIAQGARAADRIAESLAAEPGGGGRGDASTSGVLDLLVVGAGPAGISAGLRAGELGLACEVVEQGSVAQSIRSFPRGKLVFDQPLDLPVAGKLWLRESTKEELLAQWLRIVRQSRLPVREDTRVTGVRRDPATGLFHVSTEPREPAEGAPRVSSVTVARRVLLAVGQRGSPRRLPVALTPEVEARVHYHLADARSFEGARVVVVGLGDVAMEAAIALSRQPGTSVTMVHRGEGLTRGKARNVAEIERLVAAGRVGLRLSTEIAGITAETLELRGVSAGAKGAKPVATLAYDAVLVMIGSIPPSDLLRAAGVRTAADEASSGPTQPVDLPRAVM